MRWDRHVEEQIALLRTELHATDDSSVAGHLAEIEGEYADTQRQERARGHRGVTAHGQRLPARNTDSLQSLHVPGLFAAAGESGWGAGGVEGPRGLFLGAPSHADAASHTRPDMDPLQEQDTSMVHMDAMDGIRAWMGAPARVDPQFVYALQELDARVGSMRQLLAEPTETASGTQTETASQAAEEKATSGSESIAAELQGPSPQSLPPSALAMDASAVQSNMFPKKPRLDAPRADDLSSNKPRLHDNDLSKKPRLEAPRANDLEHARDQPPPAQVMAASAATAATPQRLPFPPSEGLGHVPFQRFWGQLPVGFPSEHARPSPDFGGKDPSLSLPRQERFDDDMRQELGHGIYHPFASDPPSFPFFLSLARGLSFAPSLSLSLFHAHNHAHNHARQMQHPQAEQTGEVKQGCPRPCSQKQQQTRRTETAPAREVHAGCRRHGALHHHLLQQSTKGRPLLREKHLHCRGSLRRKRLQMLTMQASLRVTMQRHNRPNRCNCPSRRRSSSLRRIGRLHRALRRCIPARLPRRRRRRRQPRGVSSRRKRWMLAHLPRWLCRRWRVGRRPPPLSLGLQPRISLRSTRRAS